MTPVPIRDFQSSHGSFLPPSAEATHNMNQTSRMRRLRTQTNADRPRRRRRIAMALGEGCERKPLLHKGVSDGKSLPRDALHPPSFNAFHHIQKDTHSFRRTREDRNQKDMHGAAMRQHKRTGREGANVREVMTINQRPEKLNAYRVREVERTGRKPRGRGKGANKRGG